jgi:hypothetical protein
MVTIAAAVGIALGNSGIVAMAQVPDALPEIDSYNASGDAPTGPPIGGLAVSLQPYRSVYRLGSPIWVVAELRNLSGQGLQLGSLFMGNYVINVVDLSVGRAVPLYRNWQMRLDAFTSLGGVAMPAKWSHFAGLRLDRLVQINRPGTYSVRVTVRCGLRLDDGSVQLPSSTEFQSNTITIQVEPPGFPIATAQWSSGRPPSPSRKTPAGAVAGAFALAVSPAQSKIELGTRVSISVELRDVSGTMHSVLFGSPHDYEYTIVDHATGRVIAGVPPAPDRAESRAVPWDSRLVYGESSLYGNLELPPYKFALGTYTVRITGRPTIDGKRVILESNPIEITFVPPPTPEPQVALAESQKVMSVRLETDRAAYTSGEPVRVRFVVTNLTGSPLDYLAMCSPFVLSAVSDGAVRTSNRRPCATVISRMPRDRIPLGTTTIGWGYPYPYHDQSWPKLDLWGLHLTDPGEYEMTARGELKGTISTPRGDFTFSGANVVGSPAVTIRILTRESARAAAGEKLADARLNAAFTSFVGEYSRLSSPLRDIIVLVAMGVNHSQLSVKLGEQWQTDEKAFQDRVGSLPSAGNPMSSYQEVNANLEQAAYELGAAEDHALGACDARAATADLMVADYFIRAVQSELRSEVAKPGDAADPPPAATGWGYCK